jgi:hypothetical protein
MSPRITTAKSSLPDCSLLINREVTRFCRFYTFLIDREEEVFLTETFARESGVASCLSLKNMFTIDYLFALIVQLCCKNLIKDVGLPRKMSTG